ncbi:aminodeoxychorismate synthase component I [Candidatus Woesearchaeota archaeon]|nr:aminodeoxychorismate synthase component I [Candidatus Woesearchaeota archaeon]
MISEYPSKSAFNKLKGKFNMVPLFTKLKIKEDIISVYKRFRGNNSFILHSSRTDKSLGRYSFIGFEPFLRIKSKGNDVFINDKLVKGNPVEILKRELDFFKSPKYNDLPICFGGAFGYFAYGIANLFEKLPKTTTDDIKAPDLYFLFLDKSIVYDHISNELYIIVLGNDYYRLLNRLYKIKECITNGQGNKQDSGLLNRKIKCGALQSNFKKSDYIKAIHRVKEYIRAGDTFQVNLSQRLEAFTYCDALAIYENLIEINPAPFSALLEFEELKIISSSPERLVRLENGIVSTRPIAGTRPRGKTKEEDLRLERELLNSNKELAEHTMLVDLERNDLGRVCDYGSVKLTETMVVERYSHVMHLVSNITGKLHKSKGRFDLIKAVFPGGTVTGCPKIRTMEIIDELEPTARGPYTGSLGYFNFSGDMDFNIIIRTLIMKSNKIYFQVGGGIVADSVPEQEYKETLYKAEAMIEAIKGGAHDTGYR